MLWFLKVLGALSLLTGFGVQGQTLTEKAVVDITACPFTYFGQQYNNLHMFLQTTEFSICFKGIYNDVANNDCILLTEMTVPGGSYTVQTAQLPSQCANTIFINNNNGVTVLGITLSTTGSKSSVGISSDTGFTDDLLIVSSLINDMKLVEFTFLSVDLIDGATADFSGCRFSDIVLPGSFTLWDPRICSNLVCDKDAIPHIESTCGPLGQCDGLGRCLVNVTCTIAASTVIDYYGGVHAAPDRCAYSLFSSYWFPGFQVLGVFRERRRLDVSLLDHVILQLSHKGPLITLEQGGRVLLNDTELTVNSTSLGVYGVELYKDETGVTASVTMYVHNITVFFDGNTAQIFLEGFEPAIGLCSDGNFTLDFNPQFSEAGCEVQHEELDDKTIDCEGAADWCNLLLEAPFTSCHDLVDPQPFISACNMTLCSYPSVDDIKCQFMEAYTRVCEQQGDIVEDSWRLDTVCPTVPEAFCQDLHCSHHEFCGERFVDGGKFCLCRALFSSKYSLEQTFGEPTQCEHNTAQVTLARCLLDGKNIDFHMLHLNDETCRGVLDNQTHMVTFGFDSSNTCGTVITMKDNQVIYKNSIMTRNMSQSETIFRHNNLDVDLSCFLTQPSIQTLTFNVKDWSVARSPEYYLFSAGEWEYSLSVMLFTDPERKHMYKSNAGIELNQRLWVELKSSGLDDKLTSVVTKDCWATDQPASNASLRYDIIINGCPNPDDPTVQITGNGLGTSNYFSFPAFQFVGGTLDIFLHCLVDLCDKASGDCAPSCDQKSRVTRSVKSYYNEPNLITMTFIH
ncbi:alpha-tectorin-like [Synchiropus splendidus]|uniref:alpha-tectorin-like n=1 Tax=Synchiropus splendidus TaxID=270530 RepID=UPI00237E84CC|nr:alpha-tectorin-like [Synchiropus splendidus]